MKFLDQLWDSVKDVKELAKSADAAHDVNELVKAKSADVAKDITDTVKEKSVGAAKDIRAKVAEKTERK